MSKSTPQVCDGLLMDKLVTEPICLDSPAWFEWLRSEAHHTFHFTNDSGGFTARKERRQRGDCYWVAYRQFHNKLHKHYLGKSDALTQAHLCEASSLLANAIAAYEQEHAHQHDGKET